MDISQRPESLFYAGSGLSISNQLRCRLHTWAVFVEGPSGVVVYGEIAPHIKEGEHVTPGTLLGVVIPVLAKDKGRPGAMLHIELHAAGSRLAPEWLVAAQRPEVLRDPTPFLLACCS